MNAEYFLGIDVGTSSVKAVLISAAGKLAGSAAAEVSMQTPRPGWAEQDPEDWYRAAAQSVQALLGVNHIPGEAVQGIGLTGQMHTLVCLGADEKPLRPAITWADQRSGGQVSRLVEEIGRQRLAAWTGNPIAAGFMLASWCWLRENEPEILSKARWLMLPKDYLRLRLTGLLGSEPSDASSTLLFHPHTRTWSAELLRWLGMDAACLPPLGESAQVAGKLRSLAANDFGLKAGIPVVFGCSDQAAQAIAQGVIQPGKISCTIGTGGQLFAPLNNPRHDPQLRVHLFCHALPHTWHLEAAMLSAGLSLRWLRDQFWPGTSYQDLTDLAVGVEAGLEGLFFLPYLVGERTPHMDPNARGTFSGLRLHHGKASLVRAVMEGVVFGLRQGLELIEPLAGKPETMLASGGGTNHPLWLQLQANIFNRSIAVSQVPEATGRGAALLAAVGSGIYPDVPAAVCAAAVSPDRFVEPDPLLVERYEPAYRQFCSLYPALRPIWK